MTNILLALILIMAILQVYFLMQVVVWIKCIPPEPVADPVVPRVRTRVVTGDPAWSPEGWGPPDSEVTTTEGDDYLMRMKRPPPDA